MKYPKQTILVVALLGLFSYQLIQPAPAEAASVLEAFAPANTLLTTHVRMQYTDFTGHSDEDSFTIAYYVDPENGPHAYTFWDVSLPPVSSSNPNDGIDAQMKQGLEFAQPVPGATYTDDTFVFDASGQINVQDARTTRGHPADGTIIGSLKAEFALEPGFGGATQGDVVGMLVVPETNLAPGLTYLDFRFAETHTISGPNGDLIWLEIMEANAPFNELQFELLWQGKIIGSKSSTQLRYPTDRSAVTRPTLKFRSLRKVNFMASPNRAPWRFWRLDCSASFTRSCGDPEKEAAGFKR